MLYPTIILVLLFSILIVLLFLKIEKNKELHMQIKQLQKSLDEIDEQAKLILRTDIELNKTQEDLDRKITSLYALQNISREITTTLDEQQIFQHIKNYHLEDLGFEKSLAFLWKKMNEKFILVLNIGYTPQEIENIIAALNDDFYLKIIENKYTVSSFTLSDASLNKKIKEIFKVQSFIIAPLLPTEGDKGFLLVGTEYPEANLSEGSEELINILANQISQALENARLFEKTWQTQQELEKKIEERTQELSKALEDIKIISKRKTDFVSAVSHELRTPLTSIKGYTSILLSEKLGGIPPSVKERLEKINHHTDELVHLINDLLDISRIESGKITMKQEVCSLKEIIDKIADLLTIQLKEKNIQLTRQILPGAEYIFADRQHIERVFINLIGNAIKFTPSNGTISIKSSPFNDQCQIDIADTGIGIPEESLNYIFEEFYRVDNPINQKLKGTGLGLSLVKRIIEAHGGSIWVKSKLNEGTTFSFTIPKPT